MTKTIDLLTLGSIYLDINAHNFPVENALELETETVGGPYKLELGGSALHIAKSTASLGMKPAFIGKVGNDMPGNHLKTLLEHHDIKPALIADESVQTNFGINYINPKGKAVITVVGSANQSLSLKEVLRKLKKLLPKTTLLYLSGYFKLKKLQPLYPKIVRLAHQNNTQVILDHGRITNQVTDKNLDKLRQLLLNIDIYLPSQKEFKTVSQSTSIKFGLTRLIEQYPKIEICVKADDKGAYSIDQNRSLIHAPAYNITPTHTIGAGDTFNAGYLLAHLNQKSQKEKMSWGNATAAIKISTGNLPTTESLNKQLTQSLT